LLRETKALPEGLFCMKNEPDHDVLDPNSKNSAKALLALETPRTTEALWKFGDAKDDVVSADFARSLERELKERERQITEYVLSLNKAARAMKNGDGLCLQLKRAIPLVETEYNVAKEEGYPSVARKYLAQLNEAKVEIQQWEEDTDDSDEYAERRKAETERAKGLQR
jgi:hypothetical protein